jgi:hypothetical protein
MPTRPTRQSFEHWFSGGGKNPRFYLGLLNFMVLPLLGAEITKFKSLE